MAPRFNRNIRNNSVLLSLPLPLPKLPRHFISKTKFSRKYLELKLMKYAVKFYAKRNFLPHASQLILPEQLWVRNPYGMQMSLLWR
jgi:hypothetical protein